MTIAGITCGLCEAELVVGMDLSEDILSICAGEKFRASWNIVKCKSPIPRNQLGD